MASVINYRFTSTKNYSKINFDGAGLQVWELKSEIVNDKQMYSEDFDLQIFEGDSLEEIIDENAMIYKNSNIVIKRIPLWMAKSKPIIRQSIKQKQYHKQPPVNYICFRCGQKGHFIQYCPTNSDKSYDIVKIRKPTGIPKSFLVPASGDQTSESASKLVTSTGGYVRAQPQTQEWSKISKGIQTFKKTGDYCSYCNSNTNARPMFLCNHIFCDTCNKNERSCPICGEDEGRNNRI